SLEEKSASGCEFFPNRIVKQRRVIARVGVKLGSLFGRFGHKRLLRARAEARRRLWRARPDRDSGYWKRCRAAALWPLRKCALDNPRRARSPPESPRKKSR